MGFFKNFASSLSKTFLESAKDSLVDTLKGQVTPHLMDETVIQSKSILFDQMNTLLASVRGNLIELKIKARSTNLMQDDRAFALYMDLLKDFSRSVTAIIQEIEIY